MPSLNLPSLLLEPLPFAPSLQAFFKISLRVLSDSIRVSACTDVAQCVLPALLPAFPSQMDLLAPKVAHINVERGPLAALCVQQTIR